MIGPQFIEDKNVKFVFEEVVSYTNSNPIIFHPSAYIAFVETIECVSRLPLSYVLMQMFSVPKPDP